MGRVRTFEIERPEVGTIESYLTIPPKNGYLKPPLIVYPHGGPIGVADEPGFNEAVQFFASAGYAVLQVNYRGSSGFGRDFEESGWRQWGRGIEDDIDAAVETVLAEDIVDASRLCIVGESYGGYSALISTVRHPNRYRCAASMAGVTDIALLLDTSDYGRKEDGRAFFTEVIGDPETDLEEMRRHSPVYRASEMDTPVLIMQGDEDVRVDLEHAERLAMMLELHRKPHELLIMPGLGHGGWSRRDIQWYFHRLRKFLDYHLE
jgi:dipeptidyl aminopeptidase/acylaminoacyl peptidase